MSSAIDDQNLQKTSTCQTDAEVEGADRCRQPPHMGGFIEVKSERGSLAPQLTGLSLAVMPTYLTVLHR